MTVNQIMQLDCRCKQNREVIQSELKKIKPLAKYSKEEQVPFEKVEKLIVVLSKRYNVRVRDFVPDTWSSSDGTIWRAMITNDVTLEMLKLVYGLTLYECFAKTAIYMYSIREKIGRRQEADADS